MPSPDTAEKAWDERNEKGLRAMNECTHPTWKSQWVPEIVHVWHPDCRFWDVTRLLGREARICNHCRRTIA